jgi:hypothetical protein
MTYKKHICGVKQLLYNETQEQNYGMRSMRITLCLSDIFFPSEIWWKGSVQILRNARGVGGICLNVMVRYAWVGGVYANVT